MLVFYQGIVLSKSSCKWHPKWSESRLDLWYAKIIL